MKQNEASLQDEGLLGNETIEEAILALQREPSGELLAHALTTIRRQMQANRQFILAVEPPAADVGLCIQAVKTNDGKQWWIAFTSFEEEIKGSGSVMSTFLTDIQKLLPMALNTDDIEGLILNPWNRTLMLDKSLLRIILGQS